MELIGPDRNELFGHYSRCTIVGANLTWVSNRFHVVFYLLCVRKKWCKVKQLRRQRRQQSQGAENTLSRIRASRPCRRAPSPPRVSIKAEDPNRASTRSNTLRSNNDESWSSPPPSLPLPPAPLVRMKALTSQKSVGSRRGVSGGKSRKRSKSASSAGSVHWKGNCRSLPSLVGGESGERTTPCRAKPRKMARKATRLAVYCRRFAL